MREQTGSQVIRPENSGIRDYRTLNAKAEDNVL